MDRRSSIVEPTGGYGPDTRNQLNTTTTLSKSSQQRAAAEFGQRQPRPELYQQQHGQLYDVNRPPGPLRQQQPHQQPPRPAPPQPQQQQRARTPGDKISPWNLIRQALPPDAAFRGQPPPPPQQRQPPPQYYSMQRPQQQQQPQQQQPQQQQPQQQQPQQPQQQQPQQQQPQQQEQQQYRQQPAVVLPSERRPTLSRIDDRSVPPYRPENGGRPVVRPAVTGDHDDDEEVVVNSTSANQQQPPLIRRDSTVYAAGGDRQWQRPGPAAYGKPQEPQYGRQPIVEGQEQRYPPQQPSNYNRQPPSQQQQQQQQDGENRRTTMPPPPPPPPQPSTRRDSVMDATAFRAQAIEYGRRPPPQQPELGAQPGRRPPPVPLEDGYGGGRRQSEVRNKENGRDYEQQQQQQTRYGERKVPLLLENQEHDQPAAGAEQRAGNRAPDQARRMGPQQVEPATMRPVFKDVPPAEKTMAAGGGGDGRTLPLTGPPRAPAARDYAVSNNPDRNDDPSSYNKHVRPDTLKIVKDNEPLKDSSNQMARHRSDDVDKSPSKIPKKDRSDLLKTPTRAVTPKSPDSVASIGQKKLPMNKVQVGSAPSPNLKVVRSKVGSLQNTSHKPGGGQVKIENRKLEWKAGTRVVAKNDAYVPGGGDKKIQSVKLQWNAKPKVGSLENKTHKPGGGDKKIETVKLDFKDKAKPKIGSKDNIKHTPGGGAVKIEDQKLEIKAQSKVGSLDNVKHRPGGGEVKIFDDKNYAKQTTTAGTPTKSQSSRSSQAGNVAEQEI